MNFNNAVVIGTQWGDEGKGKIIDYLSAKVAAVVRFNGGQNAGHTLVIGDKKVILRLLPSGVMHEHVLCLLGHGVVIDMASLLLEINNIESQGISLLDRLKISPYSHIIFPYHLLMDKLRESGLNKIGTTCTGIGPCYEDKAARRGIRVIDTFNKDIFADKLAKNIEYYNFQFNYYDNNSKVIFADIYNAAVEQAAIISQYIADIPALLNNSNKVIFEGAQGALLDINSEGYPFVTSSSCVAASAAIGSGVSHHQLDYVLGVTKAYTTRVGNGSFMTELHDDMGKYLAEHGQEVGSVTGRARRCGWLDLVSLKRVVQTNGISALCITKLDVLDELSSIKLCIEYKHNSTPIYQNCSGWQTKTKGVTNFAQLPQQAKSYLESIANFIDKPIVLISTGAQRCETISDIEM